MNDPGRPANHRLLAWGLTLACALAVSIPVARKDASLAVAEAIVYAVEQRGIPIVVPADATEGEQRAAATLGRMLARAAGRGEQDFPILVERGARPWRAIWIGETRRGRAHRKTRDKPPFDSSVAWVSQSGSLFLFGEHRGAGEAAVSWFLEEQLGAQWFMPGPLGEHVQSRAQLAIERGRKEYRPGFLDRSLGLSGDAESAAWYGRNRLGARLEHGHALNEIFQPEDFRRIPAMAPLRNGQRYIPAPKTYNWQPDLLQPETIRHAVEAANRAFDQDPGRLSFSLSVNDSERYDESPATMNAVSPPRYFRHRPDYSNLVFGFTNAVAREVARRHPDRWLPAYAYYWCENSPSSAVEPNVVPFLTADRSQWSHPEFAAEDRALVERWCRSGARIVGAYDYFYGAPHFAPRPTLYAVRESIPFLHRAGVRAYYAETYSNWALDGPKAWLAAQLLWDPQRSPEALLDLYFREFWREAAEPMREFFAVAERTWKEQPGPPLWLRFYQDENQSWIYPSSRREELRTCVREAARRATDERVRARVALVEAGFSVTEAFWSFAAAREEASRAAEGTGDPAEVLSAWRRYRLARDEFTGRFAEVRRSHPLALADQKLEIYLRNQPDSRLARALVRTPNGRELLQRDGYLSWGSLGATAREVAAVLENGRERLVDPEWKELQPRVQKDWSVRDWTAPGAVWMGSGEIWEGRKLEWSIREGGGRRLRMSGCRTEGIGQWVAANPGDLFVATAKVRARTSPGTATFLILSFLDESGKHTNLGMVDRLPPGREVQETSLCVIARAPPGARHAGVAVRALNQINDDFAEFEQVSLRRLDSR
ncbi:MAG: DUF4838 domain-containing protein [Verrucomicrobia bacterium]|nr:DUF4838 domain-containing protein [Verrucomicrobiota bacterium]